MSTCQTPPKPATSFRRATSGWWLLKHVVALASACTLLTACNGQSEEPGSASSKASPSGSTYKVVTVTSELSNPWGLAFLPDGRMLVTERAGQMRIVSADGMTVSAPITKGLPAVKAEDQGGLLDVQIDPDYASEPWVYWSYAEPGEGGLAGTAVARGQIVNGEMTKVEVIFRQVPKVAGNGHFGSRIVFAPDKTLFVTLGERQTDQPGSPTSENAQNLRKHLGKVIRIQRNGKPAEGNPFATTTDALPEIWSLGHRNPQGAALNPATGELWLSEHGPQGGDEINRVQAGHNYGWPLRSYGCPYGSRPANETCQVNAGKHAPDFDEPLTTWVPYSIAPSGMAFYMGNKVPEWQGQLFVGALSGRALWKLSLQGNTVVGKEPMLDFSKDGLRIRDVRQGPDGWLYLLTDTTPGYILRVERQ
jgi:aldose sugar dehydrogenase